MPNPLSLRMLEITNSLAVIVRAIEKIMNSQQNWSLIIDWLTAANVSAFLASEWGSYLRVAIVRHTNWVVYKAFSKDILRGFLEIVDRSLVGMMTHLRDLHRSVTSLENWPFLRFIIFRCEVRTFSHQIRALNWLCFRFYGVLSS